MKKNHSDSTEIYLLPGEMHLRNIKKLTNGGENAEAYFSFDGFPMFTRDGKHLVFASNRFSEKEGNTNIFLAEWMN